MHWTEEDYQTYLSRQLGRTRRQLPGSTDLPEAVLLGQVRALAQRLGYLVYHTHDSRGSDDGFPDLVLVNPTRIICAELKTCTGKLTARQAVWLDLLRHTGKVEVYCWRPGDWPAIVACLGSPPPGEAPGRSGTPPPHPPRP